MPALDSGNGAPVTYSPCAYGWLTSFDTRTTTELTTSFATAIANLIGLSDVEKGVEVVVRAVSSALCKRSLGSEASNTSGWRSPYFLCRIYVYTGQMGTCAGGCFCLLGPDRC